VSRLVSPRQREALEALAAGATIGVVRHAGWDLSDAASLWVGNDRQSISMSTVKALEVQGWLTETEDPGYLWRSSRYVISEKGRAQLEIERGEGATLKSLWDRPAKPMRAMTEEDKRSFVANLRRLAAKETKRKDKPPRP